MDEGRLNILQVSTSDRGGGAEGSAWRLFEAYRRRGHGSWLAVGEKVSDDPDVMVVPHHLCRGGWSRFWWTVGGRRRMDDRGRWARWCRAVGEPRRWLELRQGQEDFDFPATWYLLDLLTELPDLVHCHNLHGPYLPEGGYFDLRVLPWLSRQVPVILNLRDAWLLSGHCAHSFDCPGWETGCGQCPDLRIPPAIQRDATVYNWQRKQAIFAESRVYVVTPSRWLMEKVERSMLTPAIEDARVIPNGVDLSVFWPGVKAEARAALGLRDDVSVLLFSANTVRRNVWKDYRTLREAVERVAAARPGRGVVFLALGEDAPPEQVGEATIVFVPHEQEPHRVAQYYQAADVYLHAARADTFPNTVLEAVACGTPVVATAVGGIPEQVRGWDIVTCRSGPEGEGEALNRYGLEHATGALVPPGDAAAMAEVTVRLLDDHAVRQQLGANAARDARQRFNLDDRVDEFLDWYQAIVDGYRRGDDEYEPTEALAHASV